MGGGWEGGVNCSNMVRETNLDRYKTEMIPTAVLHIQPPTKETPKVKGTQGSRLRAVIKLNTMAVIRRMTHALDLNIHSKTDAHMHAQTHMHAHTDRQTQTDRQTR